MRIPAQANHDTIGRASAIDSYFAGSRLCVPGFLLPLDERLANGRLHCVKTTRNEDQEMQRRKDHKLKTVHGIGSTPVYASEARYNQAEHTWRLPGGGYAELGQLEGPGDFTKYQGRSFTLLLIDEAGQYA